MSICSTPLALPACSTPPPCAKLGLVNISNSTELSEERSDDVKPLGGAGACDAEGSSVKAVADVAPPPEDRCACRWPPLASVGAAAGACCGWGLAAAVTAAGGRAGAV